MRTTVDVDEKLLAEIRERSGQRTTTKALNQALREWVTMKELQAVRAMRGKLHFDSDYKAARKKEWNHRAEKLNAPGAR